MTTLPEPPIPADVDLRTFDDMPLDVRVLRDSDLAAEVSDEAFRAAVLLWCAAWHQIPAASLPDDDQKLARLAGYGRDVRGWQKVRGEALRGFQKCSDGRLYHIYMCEKAKKAWTKKNEQKRKINKRWGSANPLENNNSHDTAVCTAEDTTVIPGNNHGIYRGNTTEQNRTEQNRSSSPLPPSPQTAATARACAGTDDRLDPEPDFVAIADAIWDLADRGRERDAYRMAGKVDDVRLLRRFAMLPGVKPDDLVPAAKSIIDRAGEIRNLWKFLAASLPEALAKVGGASAPDHAERERNLWIGRLRMYRDKAIWLSSWPPMTDAPADVREFVDREIPPALERKEVA